MTYAPILLFVYNRPEHTRQVVSSLLRNKEAADSPLFIYADQSKNPESDAAVQEVRRYIHSISGFKTITIIERETNWGLARNIIDGVTTQVNHFGRVIVLEDDLIVAPYFLKFMNDALEVYKDEQRVTVIFRHVTLQKTYHCLILSLSSGQAAGDGQHGAGHGSISTLTAKNCLHNWKHVT